MRKALQLLLLLLFPLISFSQREIKPTVDIVEISEEVSNYVTPYTGSGFTIATDAYATFQRFTLEDDRQIRKKRRGLEQKIYKKRHRNKEISYSFDLVFHNLLGMDKERFEKEALNQLESLNRDYGTQPRLSKDHPHSDKVAVPGFHFSLTSGGIVHKKEPIIWQDWESIKYNRTGGSNNRPPDKYINIWVADLPNEIGSYAQYPEGYIDTDGIVIDIDFFGSGSGIYTEGKTLTTLMAQFFGLSMLSSGDGCKDDGVDDTTVHAIHYRYSLPPDITSHCDNQPMMTDNFMSYAPESHRKYFTQGQVDRMKMIIDAAPSRASLNQGKKSVQ